MDPICPCSSYGGNALHVILLVCAAWIGFRWWSGRRDENKRREAVKHEEHNSQRLFEGKSQPPPSDSEPKSTAAGVGMAAKIAIVAALAMVVVGVLLLKNGGSTSTPAGGHVESDTPTQRAAQTSGLPRLIELGSVSCLPCKMMAPILDELRKEYPGALQVDFIDVTKDRENATKFGLRVIPTQVFLDHNGKELFRHEGFFPKEEILAKWKELGVNLESSGATKMK